MNYKSKGGFRIPVRRENRQDLEVQTVYETHGSQDEGMNQTSTTCEHDAAEWRETALRLKADMQNYRKRQDRWAKDEIQREQDRLLLGFVSVLDDLEQAVVHLDPANVTHQGVKIAYDNMLQFLGQQGVERINAYNSAFDPMWHEAVAMVPGSDSQSDPLLVTEVVNHGYLVGERLLRPARVVVGKRRF
jgi:molecular chaperone GrpE